MSIFLVGALLLPSLFWPKDPSSAVALQAAGITDIAVPPAMGDSWKSITNIKARALDSEQLVKAATPTVNFRAGGNNAAATHEPWVDSNGWRFLRQPDGSFFYTAPGKTAALAAAEAYSYGVQAVVQTDEAGLPSFSKMLQFLQTLTPQALPGLANFQFVDDGSQSSGEFMNLLVRTNLLFKTVKTPEQSPSLTVTLGSPQYPKSDAGNPKLLAEKVRANVTDEKRLLRIYGSSVVIARLLGSGAHARLFLLNYGSARSGVDGMRVRILGEYAKHQLNEFQVTDAKLLDYKSGSGFTEFTLSELPVFAVIDLDR